MQLHDRPITAREACQPVGGMHARDQRTGHYVMALKWADRSSAAVEPGKRVRGISRGAAPTGGYVREAHSERPMSKNARRKARRYGRKSA